MSLLLQHFYAVMKEVIRYLNSLHKTSKTSMEKFSITSYLFMYYIYIYLLFILFLLLYYFLLVTSVFHCKLAFTVEVSRIIPLYKETQLTLIYIIPDSLTCELHFVVIRSLSHFKYIIYCWIVYN